MYNDNIYVHAKHIFHMCTYIRIYVCTYILHTYVDYFIVILSCVCVAHSVFTGISVLPVTLLAAIRQVRRSARDSGVTFKDYGE